MQNTTNNGRHEAVDTPHDSTSIEWSEGGDMFIVAKPDTMTEDDWAGIKARMVGELLELVEHAAGDVVRRTVAAAPAGGCTERTWCVLGPNEEHHDFHGGDPVALAGYDADNDLGWSCHAYENRSDGADGSAGVVMVTLEGHWLRSDGAREGYTFDVPAARLMMTLWAAGTDGARQALDTLLDQIAEGGQ